MKPSEVILELLAGRRGVREAFRGAAFQGERETLQGQPPAGRLRFGVEFLDEGGETIEQPEKTRDGLRVLLWRVFCHGTE